MKSMLKQGDCLKLMKEIPDNSIDLIITDPPYELDNHGGGTTNLAQRKLVKEKHIDFISNGFDYEKCFEEFIRITKKSNFLIFCSNKQISKIMSYFENLKMSTTLLVWQKANPIPLCNGKYINDSEFIVYVRGKNAPFNNEADIHLKYKIKKYPTVSTKLRKHPTEKPISLLEDLIELHSFENNIILDPFMGSGSTGLACHNLGRNFVGFEIDEKYFNIAKERIECLKG